MRAAVRPVPATVLPEAPEAEMEMQDAAAVITANQHAGESI